MLIIGINAYHGDASCVVLDEGQLVAAVEEERFARIKHVAGFPSQALRYVSESWGLKPAEIRTVAVARDPWARVLRKALFALRMPRATYNRLRVQVRFTGIAQEIASVLGMDPSQFDIHRVEHHIAHMASAFFASPFDQAAAMSADGLGDFASAMWAVGQGTRLRPLGGVVFPHSLGLYYTALTQYLGFHKFGDEYKVMGLASYGEPEFLDEFRRIVTMPNHGTVGFSLGLDYFLHHREIADMTWAGGEPRIGRQFSEYLTHRLGPARSPQEDIDQRHKNIASSLQRRLEEVMLECLRRLQKQTAMKKLCLAGGVAFNCVTNGLILQETGFEDVYIQPAAGDAGVALGAALYTWHQRLGKPRKLVMDHAYWGPEYSDHEYRAALNNKKSDLGKAAREMRWIADEGELCRLAADRLANGKIVGWFQGRMEWGPRALGNRSILADPRREEMRDTLNAKIKRREMFRPFAPSILEEACGEYFEQCYPSPFMLMAYRVRPEHRASIPAVTHVDGTGRVQTVNSEQNPRYYRLIREVGQITGVPVLLNTSFNENEPVVCKPDEAVDCFVRTGMDVLVLGNWWIERA